MEQIERPAIVVNAVANPDGQVKSVNVRSRTQHALHPQIVPIYKFPAQVEEAAIVVNVNVKIRFLECFANEALEAMLSARSMSLA